MITVNKITSIDVEVSSHCNARCPECIRNFRGWNILKYSESHLDLDKFKYIINKLPNLQHINFCGNYGDPMMHPNMDDFVNEKYHNIISTNGSIGKLDTFVKLAKKNVTITFGIDGLKDTNHIYRQDVKWDNLIARAKTFIGAGGKAVWQYILFKHNINQVEQARELSKQLGFFDFVIKEDGRNSGPILDNTGKQIGYLEPHNREIKKDFNIDFELNLLKNPIKLDTEYSNYKIDCETKRRGWIYINVLGEIRPCCYFGAYDLDKHKPQGKTLQKQLDNYAYIENSWNTKQCFEKCAMECGHRS